VSRIQQFISNLQLVKHLEPGRHHLPHRHQPICMYIYIYIYIHVCIYAYVHMYRYTWICQWIISISIHQYMYEYIYIHMNIPMNQMYVWMYVYTYVCICICVCIYIYIYNIVVSSYHSSVPSLFYTLLVSSFGRLYHCSLRRVFLVRHCTGSLSVPPVPAALLRTSLGNGFQIYGI
jgi:hypothetical protein